MSTQTPDSPTRVSHSVSAGAQQAKQAEGPARGTVQLYLLLTMPAVGSSSCVEIHPILQGTHRSIIKKQHISSTYPCLHTVKSVN